MTGSTRERELRSLRADRLPAAVAMIRAALAPEQLAAFDWALGLLDTPEPERRRLAMLRCPRCRGFDSIVQVTRRATGGQRRRCRACGKGFEVRPEKVVDDIHK